MTLDLTASSDRAVCTTPTRTTVARDHTDQRSALLLHDVRLARTGPAEPWVPSAAEHLAEHTARIGQRPAGTATLIDALDEAGLTGHGGAHVPTTAKWRSALAGGGPLTVAANGAESEPLSAKDATLLRQRPHLVLDGLALTAEALGARRAVLWLHGDDTGTLYAMQAALTERRAARYPEPWLEIVSGPGHYLAGESSAIGRALNGGPALPRIRRVADADGGPRNLVHNVETLARVALIARGMPPVRSTLLTVLTPVDRQVIEVDRGTPTTEVLGQTGWLHRGSPQAVLLGGYSGMWAPWLGVEHLTFDETTLRSVGLSAGSGIIAPLPHGACGVAETAAIVGYLASMSARQCGPCLFGLPALAQSLRLLAHGNAPRGEQSRLLDDLQAVAGRGACHHPDGATRLIASALAVFEHDFREHAHGRACAGSRRPTMPVPAVTA